MLRITTYVCEICHRPHNSYSLAEECEKKGLPALKARVGDVVIVSYEYGWYDGRKSWVINPKPMTKDAPHGVGSACCAKKRCKVVDKGKCPNGYGNCLSSKCCCMGFYYVVTEIKTVDGRNEREYVLKTLAMKDGHSVKHSSLDTSDFKIVENPKPAIKREIKKIIGLK